MNVLSLFDGMSCGRVALERAGVAVTSYWASEIDKYAIQVSQANYPRIVHIGDITKLYTGDIIDLGREGMKVLQHQIDLVIGGSPCQGFSFAGKQLAFDDPRSALFFKFVEVLEYYKPKYFLLENVRMKKEHQQVITDMLGVEPIVINSSLVSAQNRVRYYWTNIPNVTQPENKHIYLKDILETDGGAVKCGRMVGRKINPETGKRDDYNKDIPTVQRYELRADDKTGTLTTVQKDNLICVGRAEGIKGHDSRKRVYNSEGKSPTLLTHTGGQSEVKVAIEDVYASHVVDNRRVAGVTETVGGYKPYQGDSRKSGISELGRLCKPSSKTSAITVNHPPKVALNTDITDLTYRKLTPLECERLQTLPDNYTAGVSNTQRYKMLGNGWTVDVLAHIFKGLL